MNSKAKPDKPPAPPKSPRPAPRPPVSPPRPKIEGRWQRAVRYGWDKGGANGGRK